MTKNKSQIVIILGRSGSGKGTQAKLLIKEFDFKYFSSGSSLRERANQDDAIGRELKEVMNKGDLVSTEIVFKIWSEKMEEMKEEVKEKGLIIDGSPRMLKEAKLMDGIFEKLNWKDIKVVLVDISEEEAFERLIERQRDDDKPEAIRERLAYFKKDVQPAIDYYQGQGRLIKIDGNQSIEDVYHDIKKAIQ